MLASMFWFMFLIAFGCCQQMTPICAPSEPSYPMCTVTFTPPMPTQMAPTSTVYGAIMTSYLNVVDCKYCMVQNVDANPMQYVSCVLINTKAHADARQGQFTTKTTVPVLTVWRVGCMPETTAITRRDYRGYDNTAEALSPIATQVAQSNKLHKRNVLTETILDAAVEAQDILPDRDNFSVEAYRYFMQINTARFAINLVNSGLPLESLCLELRNATVAGHLIEASLFPRQAGDIICYASVYGIFFNMTNQDLLSDLDTLEYALQINAGFTTNLQILCDSMDLSTADELGIDAAGIRNLVCSRASSTAGVSARPTTAVASASPLYPNSTVDATSTSSLNATRETTSATSSDEPAKPSGTAGTAATVWPLGPSGMGGPGPFVNATGIWASATGIWASATGGTVSGSIVGTSSVAATGGAESSTNVTGVWTSASGGIVQGTVTGTITSANTDASNSTTNATVHYTVHVPPSPTAPLYYPVWTTSTTSASAWLAKY